MQDILHVMAVARDIEGYEVDVARVGGSGEQYSPFQIRILLAEVRPPSQESG